MEIIVGKNAGFCFGVKRAVDGAIESSKKYKNLKCLGEIVHNEQVIKEISNCGIEIIEDISSVKANSKLIIRAHGVSDDVYKEAKLKNIELIDYTCPKVKDIHNRIKEYEKNGYQIILIGKKEHPETIGSSGAGRNVLVIETKDEIDSLFEFEKVFSIVQTTFSMSKYLEIEKLLKKKYNDIVCMNSICASTRMRQEECETISKKVDIMIVIGGKNSSNTKKLYEVAIENNKNSILIQDEYDKKIEDCRKYDIIGIMAGASTPYNTIRKVSEKIQMIGGHNEF